MHVKCQYRDVYHNRDRLGLPIVRVAKFHNRSGLFSTRWLFPN